MTNIAHVLVAGFRLAVGKGNDFMFKLINYPAKTEARGFYSNLLLAFPHIIFCAIFILFLSGCVFKELKKEVAILDQTSILQGTISSPSSHKKPLVVLLYQILKNEKKLVAYSIHHRPGTFTFIRLPGQYLIASFEDENEDFIYQSTEYANYIDNPRVLTLKPGKDIVSLDLRLKHPDDVTISEWPNLTSPATRATLDLPKISAGEIVTLEDQRFSPKNAQHGLWRPILFLQNVGGGVFFLEPFDPAKIPIVFVHGVGGNPQQWTSLIHHLDRIRYQPWIFYYPSGLRLHMNADFLIQSLSEILVKNKFKKLVVIAHSMGGLVSRSLINTIVEKDVELKFRVLFVTLSTPWGGHQAAQIGVDHAPAVIPSWIDMIPNSPFQQTLFQTRLSDHIEYYLFFSFKGGHNPFTNGNDDGTVSLLSQLKTEAQDAAIKTIGFNEDHTSILRAPHAIEKIEALLTTFADRD